MTRKQSLPQVALQSCSAMMSSLLPSLQAGRNVKARGDGEKGCGQEKGGLHGASE